jgi:hypothetical protein
MRHYATLLRWRHSQVAVEKNYVNMFLDQNWLFAIPLSVSFDCYFVACGACSDIIYF